MVRKILGPFQATVMFYLLVNNGEVGADVEGVVDGGVEPVELTGVLTNHIQVTEQEVDGLNETVGSVEAVGLGDGVDSGELVVLESVDETVEHSSHGLGIELDVTNGSPGLSGGTSVPSETGVIELTGVVEETDKTLSVNVLHSVLGGVDLLE